MIAVRRAGLQDLEPMLALWTEMWEHHAELDERFASSPMAPTVARHWIESHLENPLSAVFVAQSDRDIVGYLVATILENLPIVLNPAFGFVTEVAVAGNFRRRGIGEKLVREAHAWFTSKLITAVEVNVSVKNEVSKSFWRKMGYRDFLERLRLPLP